MNTNDGTEPCPTCNAYVPHSTLIAIREVARLRAVLESIAKGHAWPRVTAEDALKVKP